MRKTVIISDKPKAQKTFGVPVGQKKAEPVKPERRKTLISRCVDIISKDIKAMIFRTKIVIEPEPAGWEEYKRFCELAKGEKR
jgi:hypothetical protein